MLAAARNLRQTPALSNAGSSGSFQAATRDAYDAMKTLQQEHSESFNEQYPQ